MGYIARKGVLQRSKGNHRVVLSLDFIVCSIAAEIDPADVTPLLQWQGRRLFPGRA